MNRLRFRITAGFILIIVLVSVTLGFYSGKELETTYIETLASRLEKEALLIASAVDWNGSVSGTREELNRRVALWAEAAGSRITLINYDGTVLADSERPDGEGENLKERDEVRQALKGKVGRSVGGNLASGQDMIDIAVPVYQEKRLVGAVRLSFPIEQVKVNIQRIWFGQIAGLSVALLLFSLLGTRIARSLTDPVEKIIEVARNITQQRFGEKVPVKGKGEIAELARAINFMSLSLEWQLRQIKENERKLKDLLENLVSGVMLVNAKGRIILVNRAAKEILGMGGEDLIGRLHNEVIKNFGLGQLVDRVLKEQAKIREEVHIYYPLEKILDVSLVPQFDENRQFLGIVVVLHDISEIRRLEKLRSEFVANVSHELKTPVTSIKGFAETLLDGAMEDKETLRSFLQIIYNESERLQRLIQDILELSRIQHHRIPLDLKDCRISQLIDEVMAHFAAELENKRIRFEKTVPEGLVIEADWDRLKQIFINLVANAIQYTPEGGKIWIDAGISGEYAVLCVGDTGMGIPKKDLPRIFERFYRVDRARARHSGGTGLGLSIVKHLVESHNGKIWVTSEEGKGSQFYIQLPLRQTSL